MRKQTTIRHQMKLAGELSKEIAAARHGDRVANLSTHGIVLGSLYTLAWVLGLTEETPVEYARKKLEGK